ncbi:formate dehydrogenase subunit gamma [Marinobacter lipolyticus SM19]|uniref:NADH-quinone oxidoreductase subunit E n=1 Tax=Marinobacter lipolyticus SM19 TaxID=1318628 RepID=R8B1Q2_9GAMM|nr:formate dehydrogenase subunit gamma [Marinobacter lipolyticus]EON92499.1 formate dehydrogenase subunit gamma [Marinobacter lipolyticus SM19]
MNKTTATDVQHMVHQIIADLNHKPGALMPILHAIQDELGYIPSDSVPAIAEGLQITRAEVHGVISFYHDFRASAPGKHTIHICRAEACQARGCRALERHAQQTLGVDYHQTTLDGDITLEAAYCLGNCATGPSIRIGDDIHGRVTPARFDALIDQLQTVPLAIQPVLAKEDNTHG